MAIGGEEANKTQSYQEEYAGKLQRDIENFCHIFYMYLLVPEVWGSPVSHLRTSRNVTFCERIALPYHRSTWEMEFWEFNKLHTFFEDTQEFS